MCTRSFFSTSLFVVLIVSVLTISSAHFYKASVIQIDISDILNTRAVTTLTQGKMVTWTTGIDKENGYLTEAASTFMGDQNPHALPDNPLYAANSSHPEILLHYSNDDALGNQTRFIPDGGNVKFNVPRHNYSDLYLSMTSSYGPSPLEIELQYSDGIEVKKFILPDWFNDIPENDPDLSYVTHNMGKWDKKNNLAEKDHHNIDALNIHPDPVRKLTGVKINKLSGGYLVFWAATGVVK